MDALLQIFPNLHAFGREEEEDKAHLHSKSKMTVCDSTGILGLVQTV
jgi:hypothetical protein